MNTCVIGLGSNISPDRHIPMAKAHLARKFLILRVSRLAKTKPVGFKDQPYFINGAVLAETDLGQSQVRSVLKSIEKQMGRVKTANKHGPRSIDLDLLLWNGTIIDNDLRRRDFLQKAVKELLPEFTL